MKNVLKNRSIRLAGILTPVVGGLLAVVWSVFAPLSDTTVASTGPIRTPSITDLFAALNPAYAQAADLAPANDFRIVIDDFDRVPPGSFPEGWSAWRGDDRYARKLYWVHEENGNRFLRAEDDGTSIIIRKELKSWNPREYPVLTWRWRARALPKGGDERIGEKNDSAAAVYVVLDQNFFGVPKTLKYVWSTTLPVGLRHRRDGIGRPTVIVLESGPEKQGQWITESVNVYEDFVATFGKPPPNRAVGLGVLTDSNATKSPSQGDYDDFSIHRHKGGL
jgi:hypothetical protein